MSVSTGSRRRCVARERAVSYDAAPPALRDAIAAIRRGREALQALDLDTCAPDDVADALADLVHEQTALAEAEARLIRNVERREIYTRDACINVQGWLQWRTRLDHAGAQRRVKRARVLGRMPLLSAALGEGLATADHVDTIVRRAVPSRMDQICEYEETLVRLACDAGPREVAVAVQRIIDNVDPDGSEDPPACGAEDLREWRVTNGLGGLGDVRATTTTVMTELMLRVRDLYGTPDPAATPPAEGRTPAQRFHDAMRDALLVAIERHPGCAVDGVKTHIVGFVDLFTMLGQDELASVGPRLSASGDIDPETARHLIATSNTTLRMVLGLGPWMPVSVGRAQRVLPEWLRGALEMVHRHCRAPGCDRPAAWCDADHVDPWCANGVTSVTNSGLLCPPHNVLKHVAGWSVTFDPMTGTVTWISADGTRRIELPPPDT